VSLLPVPQTSHWLEILQALLLSEVAGLRQRGAALVRNLMQGDRGVAETLMASEALEILSVLAKGGGEGGEGKAADPVSAVAQSCLDTAMKYGIIQSGGRDAGKTTADHELTEE